jgi:penicillin amidase
MSGAKRIGLTLVSVVLTLAIASAIGLWLYLRASLPELDGRVGAPVSAAVTIERDELGVPTLRATSRTDLYFAQGFVHGQERFFQMDLSRRVAAGRLSELFGARALEADKAMRVHGLSLVADAAVAGLPASHRQQLDAYVAGVNAGLAELGARPFEYALLRSQPEPWQARDSLLVLLSMFRELTDEEADLDRQRGAMFRVLPPEVYRWLTAPGSSWDAPLSGDVVTLPPLPAERWYDKPGATLPLPQAEADALGSNSFAVAGSLTPHGSAILANDMHLGLRLPNIWYRLRLLQSRGDVVQLDAIGVSLPGVPGVVVGSNTHIAWGFTNSYGDYSDRVVLRTAGSAGRYRVPRGGDTLRVREELIAVRDAAPVALSVPMTRFGPVIAEDAERRPVAVRWLAHFEEAINLNLLDFLDVTEVDSAAALAQRMGIPPQNILLAGRDGRVGWTIAGRLPRRVGFDPTRPVMSDQDGGWRGWLSPADYPLVLDPPSDRLWTANGRVADLASAPLIGSSDFPLGIRAFQIRERLFAADTFTEEDLLDIALDTRGLFLERWRVLMRSMLTTDAVAARASRREQLSLLSRGALQATADDQAYRLVRAFRSRIESDLMAQFLAPLDELPDIRPGLLRQREGPLWDVMRRQPVHLLPAGFASWSEYFLHVLDTLADEIPAAATWGEANRLAIAHPMAGALPSALRDYLSVPATPMPGDVWMPRVQSPSFGASQRIVVAPGRESEALFHMPGGQSGHPLSPFFRAGHSDWVEGRPSPLLPGPTRYTLTLEPGLEN